MSVKTLGLKFFTGALKTAASTAQILLYFVGLAFYLFSVLLVWIVAFCFVNRQHEQ